MNFIEYQNAAKKTAIYPDGSAYPFLGLAEEAGEVAGKYGKILRDKNGIVSDTDALAIEKEAGDVLWMLAAICSDLGLDLETVAIKNINKLADRSARGVLGGSGDDR